MPVDPNIALQAGHGQPVGPNIGQIITLQQMAQRLRMQNQAQQGYNYLGALYSNPQNVGPSGTLTPDALRQLMTVSPVVGMDMMSNTAKLQGEQARTAFTNSKLSDAIQDKAHELRTGALSIYDDTLKKSGPEAAQRAAQEYYSEHLPELKQLVGSGFTGGMPEISPTFDADRARRAKLAYEAANAKPIEPYQTVELGMRREDLALRRQDEQQRLAQGEERLTIEQQKAAIQQDKDERDRKNEEKGQWQVLTDPGKTDASGKPIQYRYNATTAKATTLSGAPYVPTGAAKMEAASGPPASQTEVAYWTNVLNHGGALPPGLARTKQGSDLVRQIMANVPGSGTDPGQFIANHATTRANTSSLANMTKMADAATSFERTANENFDLALRLSKGAIPTNWGPWMNRWIENGETQFGNESVPPYVTAMLTAANEYAKIMSGSTGSQGSTVDSRREAAELFSPYLNAGQIERVVGIAKADMANRKGSLYGQIDDIKSRLSDDNKDRSAQPQGGNAAPATPQASPAGAPREVTREEYDALPAGTPYRVPGKSTVFYKQ